MACFVQSVYLLELDRQENMRCVETALAPQWWTPFKYKLVEPLVDERDGSIFAAVLEWDQAAALADFIPIRPIGAPKVVLAIRGTLLKNPTIRRDIQDDLRYLAWESLKGSFRFDRVLLALKSIILNQGGSKNVSITGHSLGAGFALEVYKELAAEGIYVEAHLFNPPSVSLAMSLRILSEKAGFVWKRFKSMLPSQSEYHCRSVAEGEADAAESRITSELKQMLPMPHLYVNTSDYICCYYNYPDGGQNNRFNIGDKEKEAKQTGVKLFVVSKGKQRFLEAHRLKQWWSDDLELQMALNNSMLISRQLSSLYTIEASIFKSKSGG